MLRTMRVAAAVFLFSLAAPGQHVAFEKYQLPNGMTVILHEDHTTPEACVNIWYYVGAKDEPESRSGFAHLFEHLMFMGTRRVPGSRFDDIMEAGGGFNNASTAQDRTNYFSMGPKELLPTLLWLDADRLEDLGQSMTQEKLDKQRAVVLNERRQTSENRPYGKSELEIGRLMYPAGHPYHEPVIGSHADLQAATVKDVKQFFATWYVPNNASLVVAGDFDPRQIKPLIARLFGTLPPGSPVVHAQARPVRLERETRVTLTDQVRFARTSIIYESPPRFAPGDAEMQLAAAILSDGIASRLYQQLIYERHLAVDVKVFQSSRLLGSLFQVVATARPGVALDELEHNIDLVLERFVKEGPTREELERQKAKIAYRMVSGLQSLLRKADRLNLYQFYFHQPDSFERDRLRFQAATPKGVLDWASRVLTKGARLIMRVVPAAKRTKVNPRETPPPPLKAASFKPPVPERLELSNGIKVYHWRRPELPMVALTLLLPAGTTSDPPGAGGLASLTARMLTEGAGALGSVAFANALDDLGARLGAQSGRETTTVSLSTLVRSYRPALKLLADAVRRPRFDAADWQRVRSLHIQGLKRARDRATSVAASVAMRTFFGKSHPFGRPQRGTPESVAALSLDGVKRFHAGLYRPGKAVFLVAGDLSGAEVKESLESAFGDWRAGALEPILAPRVGPPANNRLRVVLVDRPGAVQTVVTWVMPAPPYGSSERIPLRLFNTILGGSFTSRLNQDLREKHGYTYGAGSRFTMEPDAGFFTASSSVRTNVTGASLAAFLKEFRAIRGGDISQAEARKARAQARMSLIRSVAGLRGLLQGGVSLIRNQRPLSELGQDLLRAGKVTAMQLNRLAPSALPLEKALLVLVGDKEQILPQLQGLHLPAPEELAVTGNPVGGN